MPQYLPMTRPPRSWGRSTVETACPLDCPDNCTLRVDVDQGRVVSLDGGTRNPVTDGFICAKVRRFADHLYGEHRLQFPQVRDGAKGSGKFRRVSWDDALHLIATRMDGARARSGGASILPYSYGGSNGLVTHLSTDADPGGPSARHDWRGRSARPRPDSQRRRCTGRCRASRIRTTCMPR
jgi:anaerobic selenocysteine-containing dehydrogenase